MSDATNCAEFDGQQVELLPARTLLSLFSVIDLDTGGTPGTPGTPGLNIPGTDVSHSLGLLTAGGSSSSG